MTLVGLIVFGVTCGLLTAAVVAARHGAAVLALPADAAGLLRHAARWQPWRSYAVQHLWRAAAASPRRRSA